MNNDQLDVIYRDDDLIAINKTTGVVVHPSERVGRQADTLLKKFRRQLGMDVYPVHRLDRPTSGVLLFARNRETAATLARRFARKQIQKTYLAVVRGYTEKGGRVDKPLTKDAKAVRSTTPEVAAISRYARLACIELPFPVGRYATARYSLLQIEPETGRMHQIRRHMRHISHPVIGDHRYGDNKHNRFMQEAFQCKRLLLAAVELSMAHPTTDLPMTLSAKINGAFARIIDRFDWRDAIPPRWMQAGTRQSDASHNPG